MEFHIFNLINSDTGIVNWVRSTEIPDPFSSVDTSTNSSGCHWKGAAADANFRKRGTIYKWYYLPPRLSPFPNLNCEVFFGSEEINNDYIIFKKV